MGSPKSLRRFLGMVTQLGKFTPSLAETSKLLHDLLSKKNSWCWDEPLETAFQLFLVQLSHSTAQTEKPWCLQMLHHMVWEVSFYRSNWITCGSQWHMHRVPLSLQNRNMCKLRKRCWQLHGLVSASMTTCWALHFKLIRTTSHWSHS